MGFEPGGIPPYAFHSHEKFTGSAQCRMTQVVQLKGSTDAKLDSELAATCHRS